jgi:DNA invertase Pin-like site-specific DNA recombinase
MVVVGFNLKHNCIKMNTTVEQRTINGRVEDLLKVNTKTWLAEKLGITRVTLDNRLNKGNWKKSETQMILTISK